VVSKTKKMKIKDLPKNIQPLAVEEVLRQNSFATEILDMDFRTAFSFNFSKKGVGYWQQVLDNQTNKEVMEFKKEEMQDDVTEFKRENAEAKNIEP